MPTTTILARTVQCSFESYGDEETSEKYLSEISGPNLHDDLYGEGPTAAATRTRSQRREMQWAAQLAILLDDGGDRESRCGWVQKSGGISRLEVSGGLSISRRRSVTPSSCINSYQRL